VHHALNDDDLLRGHPHALRIRELPCAANAMAAVGKGFAVLQRGSVQIVGTLAWMSWAAVHLQFLAQSSLRVSVFLQWIWTYPTAQRGSRLILNHYGSDQATSTEARVLVRLESQTHQFARTVALAAGESAVSSNAASRGVPGRRAPNGSIGTTPPFWCIP